MGKELPPITYTIDSNLRNPQIQENRPEHRAVFRWRFACRGTAVDHTHYGRVALADCARPNSLTQRKACAEHDTDPSMLGVLA